MTTKQETKQVTCVGNQVLIRRRRVKREAFRWLIAMTYGANKSCIHSQWNERGDTLSFSFTSELNAKHGKESVIQNLRTMQEFMNKWHRAPAWPPASNKLSSYISKNYSKENPNDLHTE